MSISHCQSRMRCGQEKRVCIRGLAAVCVVNYFKMKIILSQTDNMMPRTKREPILIMFAWRSFHYVFSRQSLPDEFGVRAGSEIA